MNEPFSTTSRMPFAYYDQESLSLKTCQQSLLSEAPALLQRLPDSGMTVDGWLFALPMPERLTAERGGSALLPTPLTTDWNTPWHTDSQLRSIERLLPTPTAQDGANNAGPSQWNRNSDPLNVVAVKLSGGTTPRPLSDGNEPSAGQHPHPPTTGGSPADSSNG